MYEYSKKTTKCTGRHQSKFETEACRTLGKLMFLYIYVDYFHLYMPSKMADIQKGRVFKFIITKGFLFTALVSMTIPALMIFLSVILPAKVNRWANISIAIVYIPFTLYNLAGEAWMHMVFGAFVEVVLLCLIIRYAWNWPHKCQ